MDYNIKMTMTCSTAVCDVVGSTLCTAVHTHTMYVMSRTTIDLQYLTDNDVCVFIFISSDPSLIPSHVIPVFQALTGNWERIGINAIVPSPRARLFRERFSVPDQRTEAGRYYALYHVVPSWKTLSVSLYSAGETEALQIARPHVQTVTGTCTCIYVHVYF